VARAWIGQVLKLDPSRPYQVEGTLLAIWLLRWLGAVARALGLSPGSVGDHQGQAICVGRMCSFPRIKRHGARCWVEPQERTAGLARDRGRGAPSR